MSLSLPLRLKLVSRSTEFKKTSCIDSVNTQSVADLDSGQINFLPVQMILGEELYNAGFTARFKQNVY